MAQTYGTINSVVQIQGKKDGHFIALGSGFLISSDGHIVTCSHIFDGYAGNIIRIVFILPDGSELAVRASILPDMQTPSYKEDVTILKTESKVPEAIHPLLLRDSAQTEDVTVSTFGYPDIDNFEGIFSKGTIIGSKVLEQGIRRLQARFEEVEEGFSGSPVWNTITGDIIGMVYKIVNPSEALRNLRTTFITPTELIRHVLERKHLATAISPPDSFSGDEFNADWHLFTPFCAAIGFDRVQAIFWQDRVVNCGSYFRIDIHESASLYWFSFGIAVWHIKYPICFNRIYKFSIERRKCYRDILDLDLDHEIKRKTVEILEILHKHSPECANTLSLNGYALSLIHVTRPAWTGEARSNALKLFSSPSTLISHYKNNAEFDIFHENSTDSLTKLENDLLINGIKDQEYYSFSVTGIIEGFASWAGVSLFIEDKEKAPDIAKILEFEVSLQAYWWYFTHFSQLAIQGNLEYVTTHFKENKIKTGFTSLLSVGPRDPYAWRLYKEAIIKTSRINQVYLDFKELI